MWWFYGLFQGYIREKVGRKIVSCSNDRVGYIFQVWFFGSRSDRGGNEISLRVPVQLTWNRLLSNPTEHTKDSNYDSVGANWAFDCCMFALYASTTMSNKRALNTTDTAVVCFHHESTNIIQILFYFILEIVELNISGS